MRNQVTSVERQPRTYIGIIEEILMADVNLTDEQAALIRYLYPKLKNNYHIKPFEALKVESIYAYACR